MDSRALEQLVVRHYGAGNLDAAESGCRQLLQHAPHHAGACHLLGLIESRRGHLKAAEAWLARAVEISPHTSSYQSSLGRLQQDLGHSDQAEDCFRKAVSLAPNAPEPRYNLGVFLQDHGRLDEAEDCYRRVIALRPDLAAAHYNLGCLYRDSNRLDEAARSYRRALEIRPAYPDALFNLALICEEQGLAEEAARLLDKIVALEPTDGLRIKRASLFPAITESVEHIEKLRSDFAAELDRLIAADLHIADPLHEVASTNFYLAYHGLNDRELQVKVARLYAHSVPDLVHVAPHCRRWAVPLPPRKLSVGFISAYFRNHTIGHVFRGFIANLDRDQFDVTVMTFSEPEDDIARTIRQQADHWVRLPKHLKKAQQAVGDLGLDVLVYTDIGMEPVTYFLAFSRLAPVQCATWGHPVTTGIDNMDYYISCRGFEAPGSEAHYSETLVRLDHPPTYYYRPALPKTQRDRAYFGLPVDKTLYLCPQNLFKFHPDFDAALAGILTQDPSGLVVLVESRYPALTERLLARFDKTLPELNERIRFLPRQPFDDYMSLLRQSDVVLDTFHFGAGNTAYQALSLGVPIVTWPGRLLAGRMVYACYELMGVTDCVAKDKDDYVRLAVRLGTDREFAAAVRARIASAADVLFEDESVVRELERFFRDAVGNANLL
jgi:protein O-GlcNAc transferase